MRDRVWLAHVAGRASRRTRNLLARAETAEQHVKDLHDALTEQQSALIKLRRSLIKYGAHRGKCRAGHTGAGCTCGLTKALEMVDASDLLRR
jgi:hypothetical protein